MTASNPIRPVSLREILHLIQNHIDQHGSTEKLDLTDLMIAELDLSPESLATELKRWQENHYQPNDLPAWWSDQTEGLKLSGVVLSGSHIVDSNFSNVDLSHADLKQCWFDNVKLNDASLFNADLTGASFHGADLTRASLENSLLKGANFYGSIVTDTSFVDSVLDDADFTFATLDRPLLSNTDLKTVKLAEARWESWYVSSEFEKYVFTNFQHAERQYRQLKRWYSEHGDYATAGQFYFREREAHRKDLWRSSHVGTERRWRSRLASVGWLGVALLYGHGERPLRVILWVVGMMLAFSALYWFGSEIEGSYAEAILFSAKTTFSPPSSQDWPPDTAVWLRSMGVAQTIAGYFLLVLLVGAFVRKTSPR